MKMWSSASQCDNHSSLQKMYVDGMATAAEFALKCLELTPDFATGNWDEANNSLQFENEQLKERYLGCLTLLAGCADSEEMRLLAERTLKLEKGESRQ
jgi:hypothetical protein